VFNALFATHKVLLKLLYITSRGLVFAPTSMYPVTVLLAVFIDANLCVSAHAAKSRCRDGTKARPNGREYGKFIIDVRVSVLRSITAIDDP
jgi:hypothetical protein